MSRFSERWFSSFYGVVRVKTISWEDFEKVELRVGTIVDVQDFPATKTEVSGFSVQVSVFFC
jgi:tRNA-binding EMAP/Myf-like protein